VNIFNSLARKESLQENVSNDLIDPDEILMIPGPTTLSSRVRAALAKPQQSHVAPEFYETFKENLELSRYLFGNRTGSQFIITGSGTIGMEAVVVSLLEPGYFGHRFSMLAEIHGAKVQALVTPLGERVDTDDVEQRIKQGNVKALLFTHVDTSTSVMNDIMALTRIAKENNVLSICDSVCGIGGAKADFDQLGTDVILTGSQKAIAAPPGATLLAVSKRAIEVMEKRKVPIASYYMNLLRWKPVMEDPKIYLTTPAVQVMLGLHEALLEIKEEGLENRWRRHQKNAEAFRAGLEALGLKILPDEKSRSPTVTTFYVPSGMNAGELQERLRSEFAIHISRGFGDWKETMLRVGHFGNTSATDILALLAALELVVTKSSKVMPGKAVEAAAPLLRS
jgi:alanine-glyoxylate transaminase/serine-glyoxylate transaminase/serine-pyruvate transaminase